MGMAPLRSDMERPTARLERGRTGGGLLFALALAFVLLAASYPLVALGIVLGAGGTVGVRLLRDAVRARRARGRRRGRGRSGRVARS